MRKAVLLLALLLTGAALGAETYMLLVESILDGQPDPSPPAVTEGLMSALFEAGQVTFDCGPYRPEADWQHLQFREPLEIAFEGGAHYLATIRVEVRTLPAESPLAGSPPADSPPAPAGRLAAFALQARFQLWDPHGGARLGEAELELDNRGREEELPYEALLMHAGELAAGKLMGIAEGR
jgi:hypothetical protein